MAERSGYAGKISNKGSQTVNAVYKQKAGKGDKVTKHDDLRVKKGK